MAIFFLIKNILLLDFTSFFNIIVKRREFKMYLNNNNTWSEIAVE